MSGIWPFFNSSYSNASINRILVEIEMDQQRLPLGVSPQASTTPNSSQTMTATRLLHSIQENDVLSQEQHQSQPQPYQQQQPAAVEADSPTTSPNPAVSDQKPKPLNQLLLNKLLDQENLVMEINSARNAKLIQYISQDDVIRVLIEYVLTSLDIPLGNASVDVSEMIFKASGDVPQQQEPEQDSSPLLIGEDDPLLRAIKRAETAIDILTVTTTNSIMQALLNPSDFSLLSQLWRGILNRPASIFVRNADIPPPGGTEEDNEMNRAIETHNPNTFNKFLKLVDNFSTFNIHGFMNFIRLEQSQEPEQTRSLSEQFLSFVPYFPQASDILIRMISLDRPFYPTGLIDILLDQNLIYETLKLVRVNYLSHSIQDNLCVFLNGLVGISSNVGFWNETNTANESFGGMTEQGMNNGDIFNSLNGGESQPHNPNIGPNDLTRQLVGRESVLEIMEIIVKHGAYGLVTCVSVIIEVIRKNNSDYDDFDWITSVHNEDDDLVKDGDRDIKVPPPSPRDPIYLGTMLKIFSAYLPEIVDTYLTDKYYRLRSERLFSQTGEFNEDHGESVLDKTPVYNRQLKSSIGKAIEPLGHERFKVMELIAELLHCSNMALMNRSAKLDYLILKRDQWRDVKQTEMLVRDALKDDIVNTSPDPNGVTVFDYNKIAESRLAGELDELSLDNGQPTSVSTINVLSSAASNSTKINDMQSLSSLGLTPKDYIPTPFGMSVGCFFKYQLLQTRAVREIVLKLHRFPWNNFMHNVIFDLIQQIFNGRLLDDETRGDAKEVLYQDNLGINKILVSSFFGHLGDFSDEAIIDDSSLDQVPGSFNLPAYILFCLNTSELHEENTGFKLGYMGHLILIAEEIVKFQNILESIHLNQEETEETAHTVSTAKASDSLGAVYLRTSKSIFDELYEDLFGEITESGETTPAPRFSEWSDFINTQLIQIRDMYNQVLGGINPEDSASSIGDQNIQLDKEHGVILLDNGDSEEFAVGLNNEEAIEDDYDIPIEPLGDQDSDSDENGSFDEGSLEEIDAQGIDDSPSLTFEDESLGESLRPMSRYSDDDDDDDLNDDDDDDDGSEDSQSGPSLISRGRSRE
ncbi:unnamed protein product [Kuraishia capsulata CBS 1993]|uniref:Uncharacterized protein n=1 Tax=Kuraishia capsulata CBS 1993 TaxID=1382522 RepID=W6MRE0_9ASCO|nr:uncharacterized protein KUCA_T00005299001 [Kuraishia capsulata CBS 1993]CDK29311.1 unnamed protein product [Kuraishia capsulata CBS 1993]